MSKQGLLDSINRMLNNLDAHHLRKVYYLLIGFTGGLLNKREE